MDLLMILLSLILVMIAAMEIADFVSGKAAAVKETAQRKAVFQSFYEADKQLKYLK